MSRSTHYQPRIQKLSTSDRRSLKKYVESLGAQWAAAENIGIHRHTISKVLKSGTGEASTLDKIRTFLSSPNNTSTSA